MPHIQQFYSSNAQVPNFERQGMSLMITYVINIDRGPGTPIYYAEAELLYRTPLGWRRLRFTRMMPTAGHPACFTAPNRLAMSSLGIPGNRVLHIQRS